jgi:hypothetical protein
MSRPNETINESTLRQQLVECTRMMVMAELLDYSGHLSARGHQSYSNSEVTMTPK